MSAYILRRLLLIVPTLFAIMVINFIVVQAAPGGPVEQMIARLKGEDIGATARVSGGESAETTRPQQSTGGDQRSSYRGAQGLDPALIEEIEKLYGFDKPAHERFFQMMGNYLRFDFGESFYRDTSVVDLVLEKM
ncbi:MAG: microcin ABC transporter permease, partial [Gammaproteobacteria bacterium]|nr:microcin ABC transporter permease [Gammaproteobacteria bacterium]